MSGHAVCMLLALWYAHTSQAFLVQISAGTQLRGHDGSGPQKRILLSGCVELTLIHNS